MQTMMMKLAQISAGFPEKILHLGIESRIISRIREFRKGNPISKYGYLWLQTCKTWAGPKIPKSKLASFESRAHEIPTISHRGFHAYETAHIPF